jgi:hypothetical protein
MRYSIGSKTNSVASGGLQNMWNPKAIAGSLLAGSISLLSLVCFTPNRATAQVSTTAKIQQLYLQRQQNVTMYKYHSTICSGGSATYGPAYQTSCQILPVYRYYINQLNIILLQYGIPGVNPDAR